MLLRQNNAAAVREDGIFKIVPISSVRGSVSPQLGGTNLPLPQGFSVIVVPLKFVGAKEMAKILEPFSAENTVRFDDVRNLVIMAGNQRELRHLLDTIELFDVDWLAGFSIGIFPIRSSDVKALVADLDKVFGATATGPLAGLVRVVPIERLNSLLIVTTQPKYLESARSWVERLDQLGGTSTGSRLFVYQVRNGKAESLANLISELFTKRSTTSVSLPQLAPGTRAAQIGAAAAGLAAGTAVQIGQQPAQSQPSAASFAIPGAITNVQSDVRVIADKDNNALLILATPNDFEIIESALNKLDVIQKQVLVEVTVCEITLDDTLKYGIDWYINGGDRVGPNSSGTAGSLQPRRAAAARRAGIVPAFTGLQLINRLGGDVRVVLNALGTDGKLAVLATPQLMVLDNQKATIKIGDKISVQTQQQTVPGAAVGVINSFQYIETGILLSVTPRINSGRPGDAGNQPGSERSPAHLGARGQPRHQPAHHDDVCSRGLGRIDRPRGPDPRGQHVVERRHPAAVEDPVPRGGVRVAEREKAPHRTDHPGPPHRADRFPASGRGHRRAAPEDALHRGDVAAQAGSPRAGCSGLRAAGSPLVGSGARQTVILDLALDNPLQNSMITA